MYKRFGKRLVDIIIGLFALPVVFLFLIICGPIIYFTDKGPIFYNAKRVGKNGKIFTMYKFRSMRVNAPDIRNVDGSTYSSDNDPRVTRIGKIMRKTSIDEFPQFLNVLKGDMSVIGPRPNLPTVPFGELSELEQRRLAIRPGITGYNQAYYRNSVSAIEKYKNDVFYVDNLTLLMDVRVLLHTVISVLKRENINIP